MASEAKVAYHLKQLLKMFARANDAAFLQMIWAVDALQSGREAEAKPHFRPIRRKRQQSLRYIRRSAFTDGSWRR